MTQQNRFCPNCGAALAPDARFCENCGKPVAAQPAPSLPPAYSAPPPPPVYSAPPPPYSAPPPAAPRSKKGLVIGLVIAGLLALLCCGVIGIYWAYQNFQGAIAIPQSIQATITQVAIEMPKTLPPATMAPPATAESLPATAVPQQDTPAPPPPGSTTAPKPPDDRRTRYDYQGIAFSYDPKLAAAVEPETVEAETGMFSIPQHRRLVFLDYPLAGANHQAQILVFPVQQYQSVDPEFGDRFATLQQMLISRSTSNLPQPLPFFPSWNAGQIIAAQVKYLDFGNGSGVRYLTQYGQDVYPINNQALFYTFQGITSDKQWLVSAILPVSNSVLPDPEVLIQTPGFYDNFSAYLQTAKDLLDGLPDSSYQPDLALLDAMFQSLAVK